MGLFYMVHRALKFLCEQNELLQSAEQTNQWTFASLDILKNWCYGTNVDVFIESEFNANNVTNEINE